MKKFGGFKNNTYLCIVKIKQNNYEKVYIFLFDADYGFAFVTGLLGKGCRHLPSRIVYTNDDNGSIEVFDYQFRYTFNDDGTLATSEYSLDGAPYVKTQYNYEEVGQVNQIENIRKEELMQKYDVLVVFFLIIWIFTSLTTTYYFNPLLLLMGYKFYNVTSNNGIELFVISRRVIRKNETNITFPQLKKLTELVYIEI